MDPKHAARGFLGQFIDRTPHARNVELAPIDPNHQQVCLLLSQNIHDRIDLMALNQMAVDFNTIPERQGATVFLQKLIELNAVALSICVTKGLAAWAKAVYAGKAVITITWCNFASSFWRA